MTQNREEAIKLISDVIRQFEKNQVDKNNPIMKKLRAAIDLI